MTRSGGVGERVGAVRDLRVALGLLDVSPWAVIKAVTAGVVALGSAIALGAVSAWLIARASQMPPVMMLSVATVAVRAFGVTRGLFRYLERLASHQVALSGMASLRTNVYDRLSRGNIAAVTSVSRGDLMTRVSADVDAVGDVIVKAVIPGAVAAVLSVGSLLLIGSLYPPAALTLAVCMILAGVVAPWLAQRAGRGSEQQISGARSGISEVAHDLLHSPGQVLVHGDDTALVRLLGERERLLDDALERNSRLDALAQFVFVFAVVASAVSAAVVSIPATNTGVLSPVALAVVVLTPLAVFEIHQGLPAAALQLHTSATAARRIVALLDDAARPLDDTATDDLSAVSAHPTLVAEGLAAGWPGHTVVSGVSLTARPGQSIALAGPSGTGKTTLLYTLAGLLPAHAGRVMVDGARIGPANQHDAAAHVVVVAEDDHVFDTTILENLRVARGDVTPDDARAALAAAGLAQWVEGLPEGLDTVLGPDGTTMSGGERRRLLVARALCSAAPIVLFDEPGEHLDPATADTVITDLLTTVANNHGRTVVVATHRLTPLRHASSVVYLEDGGIAARGSHEELVAGHAGYRRAVDTEAPVVQ